MIINVVKIPEQGLKIQEEEPGEILGLDEASGFIAEGPVSCRFYVQVVDNVLIVRGTLSVSVKARCGRCTQFFSTTVTDSGFLRDFPGIQGAEEVDITEDIREALILSLPHSPRCGESCRGLCIQCGKNLNDGPCECRSRQESGPWGALNSLKL